MGLGIYGTSFHGPVAGFLGLLTWFWIHCEGILLPLHAHSHHHLTSAWNVDIDKMLLHSLSPIIFLSTLGIKPTLPDCFGYLAPFSLLYASPPSYTTGLESWELDFLQF